MKAFLTGEADEILNDKIHKLAESQHLTYGLVRNFIKTSTTTVTITRIDQKQAGKAVASKREL